MEFEFVGNGITKVEWWTFVLKISMWGSMHLLSPFYIHSHGNMFASQ